jgi:hypothetical protein
LEECRCGGLVEAHRERLVGERRRGTNACLANTVDAVVTTGLDFRRGIDICLDSTINAVANTLLTSRRSNDICLDDTINTVANTVLTFRSGIAIRLNNTIDAVVTVVLLSVVLLRLPVASMETNDGGWAVEGWEPGPWDSRLGLFTMVPDGFIDAVWTGDRREVWDSVT